MYMYHIRLKTSPSHLSAVYVTSPRLGWGLPFVRVQYICILTFTGRFISRIKHCARTILCATCARHVTTSDDNYWPCELMKKRASSLRSPGLRWHSRRPSVVSKQRVSLKYFVFSCVLWARVIFRYLCERFFHRSYLQCSCDFKARFTDQNVEESSERHRRGKYNVYKYRA